MLHWYTQRLTWYLSLVYDRENEATNQNQGRLNTKTVQIGTRWLNWIEAFRIIRHLKVEAA